MTKIIEQETRFDASIKEGEQKVESVTYTTENGSTFRYFDRDRSKEPAFSDMMVFTKLEVDQK